MDISSVLTKMGFTSDEVSDYDYMVPEYDPYFSNIALDEYNLDLESIGLKEEGYKAQIDTATSLYDMTKNLRVQTYIQFHRLAKRKGMKHMDKKLLS